MEVKLNLSKDDKSEVVNELLYSQLVGGLIHLTTTRAEITFVVGMLSRFFNCLRETHWNTSKRVFMYIKGTSQFGIVLEKIDNFMLKGFLDADWVGDAYERKSTIGYAFTLGSGVISWKRKKQPSVVLSTTKTK